jgi:type II secretory pathway component PulM
MNTEQDKQEFQPEEQPKPGVPEAESENLEEFTAPEQQPETRLQRFLRLSIRWLAGFLIVFGLGILATVFVLYRPTAQQLSEIRANLDQSQQQVSELESQVSQLKGLEANNKALQDQLDQANLHIQILSALSDVNAARLDVANDDIPSARVKLTNTPGTLKQLENLVGANQKDAVVAMQNRLDLALGEMDRDSFAALSDLEVLATNLVQLENTFFTQ